MKKILALCLVVVLCLCTLSSCGALGFRSISYQDAETERFLMDGYAPKWAKPGDTVVLRTGPIMDADLEFYANGVRLENTHNDSDYWEYVFTMPDEDVVITHDIVGGGPTLKNYFLRELAGCEWLNEITAEDIAEIKITKEYVGVAPGNLKNIERTDNPTVIARIFEGYYSLDTTPIPNEQGYVSGGGAVTVCFILKNGEEKILYFNNGNYWDTNEHCFELLYTPKFEESDNVAKSNGFITYIGTGTVYDIDKNIVCEIPMDELEFVEFDGNVDCEVTGDYYTVETEFGTLYFPNTNYWFYRHFDDEDNPQKFYKLVGKNLDQLIAEYSATATD